MSSVTGNNFTMYSGDAMNVIGCESSCTVNLVAQEIITTTKGSGRGTNRETGRYDATLTSSGVVFIYASEATAAAAGRQDPLYFHSYILQGKKVCAKYQFTDGLTTKYAIANWVVRSAVYSGNAGEYSTYDIELALDGLIYESATMKSGAAYDGPNVFTYKATGTVSGFSDVLLENSSRIYFITLNGNVFDAVQTLALATDIPVGAGTVGYHAATGTVNFADGLVNNDRVLISYDNPD